MNLKVKEQMDNIYQELSLDAIPWNLESPPAYGRQSPDVEEVKKETVENIFFCCIQKRYK
jgi:hypothetical protein